MKKLNMSKKDLRKFGLTTGIVIALLFGFFFPWVLDKAYPASPWIISAVLILWALIAPSTLGPIYKVWMKIGHALGWVNSRIILGIMFYLIITPVGVFMRLIGKNPLKLKIDKSATTYRVKSEASGKSRIEKPF